jgi:glycosyltransferase involved in cell wall biosynthesis
MKLSFVIPVKNEENNVEKLVGELVEVLKKQKSHSWEIVFVDDGSYDNTFEVLRKLHGANSKVKVIKLRGNFGKAVALSEGFRNVSGDVVFTMDGDLQDNPKEIPNFLKKMEEGYDLVSGWKKTRHDPLAKVIPSRILNYFLIPLLTGVDIHDTNCGFKAYRSEVIKNTKLYGELYRYIPIMAYKQNYKVGEIEVDHRKRKYGKSKYGWFRMVKGFLDLITVVFLTGYLKRPGHFFGLMGLASFVGGFVIGLYISYLRFTTGSIQYRHPLLFLGMLLMIIGVQLVSTGLVAEMITHWRQQNSSCEDFVDEKLL